VCTWSHATAAPGAPASATGRMGTRPMVLGLRSGRAGRDGGDRAQHGNECVRAQPAALLLVNRTFDVPEHGLGTGGG